MEKLFAKRAPDMEDVPGDKTLSTEFAYCNTVQVASGAGDMQAF